MEEFAGMVAQIATETKRQYPMLDRDDISQELWLWMVEHGDKVDEWAGQGKAGEGKLAKALRRRARAYATVEKAAVVGYEVSDLYWYSTGQLRELLPAALDRDTWADPGVPPETGPLARTGKPDEGGNRIAMLCDVRSALEAGSPGDKLLLWTVFGLGMPEDEHAMTLGITVEALRTRTHRAVVRLQKRLGGPRIDGPYHGTRRAISNAQAQAITRNQESEE
jgi:DNA-directed RNA polymerase specialized sigma24 family protein